MRKRAYWLLSLLAMLGLACNAVGLLSGPQPLASEPAASATLAPTAISTPTSTSTWPPTETALPTPAPSATPTLLPTATGPRPSPSPLHTQVFEQLWGLINENYLYRDFNGLDWEAVRQETLQQIGAGLTDDEFYQSMRLLVASLGDQHSSYFSPEQSRQMDSEFAGEFEYVGIGVYSTPVAERSLFSVLFVFPGSPAEQAGLQPHDNILAVDGQSLFDEQGKRINRLLGPADTTITLTVQTPGQEPRQLQVTRKAVVSEMPVPHRVAMTPAGKRVGYLLIPTFTEDGIDRRVGEAIQEMAAQGPLDGLIVDNRYNGGGRSEIMLGTLALFTNGEVGYYVQRDRQESIQVSGVDQAGSQGLPLVVLVGKATASFGEVFAGVLKDLGRATIIGDQTDGNVELLQVFDLLDGSRAWVASGTFRPLNDPEADWEKTGILPDTSVSSQWDQVTFESDPVILEALRFLGG